MLRVGEARGKQRSRELGLWKRPPQKTKLKPRAYDGERKGVGNSKLAGEERKKRRYASNALVRPPAHSFGFRFVEKNKPTPTDTPSDGFERREGNVEARAVPCQLLKQLIIIVSVFYIVVVFLSSPNSAATATTTLTRL